MGKISALKSSRRTTRALLILLCVLVVCVAFVGLDNATGIILGWMAALVIMALFVRGWRKMRYYLILMAASAIGTIALSFIYMDVALPLATWLGGVNATESLGWRIFHIVISDVILLFTPTGILVGIVGTAWLGISRLVSLQHRSRPDTT